MSLVKLFDLVDENLNPFLIFEGLENFYKSVENSILEYHTHNLERGDMSHSILINLLSNSEENYPEYYDYVEKSIFKNLNKKFNLKIKDYDNLIQLKKSSNYQENYVEFEEHLDKILDNISESELRVIYSKEAMECVKNLEGQIIKDVEKFNFYLRNFYNK